MDTTTDPNDETDTLRRGSPSRSAAPATGRHVAVLGHFAKEATYSVSRPRGARSWLLTWTIAGRGIVTHDGVTVAAEPGELVALGADTPQRYGTAGTTWEFWWAHCVPRARWAALLEHWRIGPGIYRTNVAADDRPRLTAAFARALEDISPGSPVGSDTIVVSPEAATDLALNAIEEVLLVAARGAAATIDDDPGIAAAVRTITSNPAAPHTVASLAAVAARSPAHFAREFKRRTGRTPMEAVRQERLDLAEGLLLSTTLAIADVARAAGFADPFYFSRVFRRSRGLPPSRYRGG